MRNSRRYANTERKTACHWAYMAGSATTTPRWADNATIVSLLETTVVRRAIRACHAGWWRYRAPPPARRRGHHRYYFNAGVQPEEEPFGDLRDLGRLLHIRHEQAGLFSA